MLWEVQKPAMSTGQTRTYPFLQKDKTAWCLPARLSMAKSFFAFLALSTPDHPAPVSLKTPSISRQPALRAACCYRRTFPPSISRMTVFNAIWKIPSERLDDGSILNCFRLLWGGWLIRTLQVFVLIVSSRISRNRCVMSDTRACYEHWADADISCLLVCLWQRISLLSWLYQLPTTQPLFSLKTPFISRQPTFRTACCYRRTFPPSISRMTVFNAIWKILSERLDDGSGLNCFRLLWGGWLTSDATGFRAHSKLPYFS